MNKYGLNLVVTENAVSCFDMFMHCIAREVIRLDDYICCIVARWHLQS